MADIQLYNLQPSPNSAKVRIALNYKELAWDRIDVDPSERDEIVRVSGQPLTPVLVHGEVVLFDSNAIVRYLESNFRKTRPLFSTDRDTIKKIEEWELFGKTTLGPPVGALFQQIFAGTEDASVIQNANARFNAACREIEKSLSGRSFLVGGQMTAADVFLAPFAACGTIRETSDPILGFFRKHLHLDSSLTQVAGWIERVTAFDR